MEARAMAKEEEEEERRPLLGGGKGGGWRACVLILGTELSDCLAFAGVARNLVSYLTGVLGESNLAAARDVSAWTGTCNLTPLLGAFMADSYLGRRATIALFLSVYTIGMITLTLSASFTTSSSATGDGVLHTTVYLGLYLVALGVGGIRPCASPLGADQFDDAAPERASFFNWYYFCVNVGSLLSATVLVWVQDRTGWSLGFGIPAAVMAVSLAVFLLCARMCGLRNAQTPTGSPLTRLCQVAVAAVRKRAVELSGDSSRLHQLPDGDHRIIEHTDQFAFLDKAAVLVDDDASPEATSPWALCTVTQVEELKMLLRLSTVWPPVVFFFAVTAQMPSTFVEQGKAMDTRVGPVDVPPATMSTFEVAPDTMKSLSTALSFVAVAAGSYLNSAVVAVVAWATEPEEGGGGGWIPDDLDHGRLDCFFWLMAGLSCLNLLAFVFSSINYTYKDSSNY
uniref:Major facilitator superfamily (MFS) profile domain-containing protein n=1 Tax=Oryza brachyantha TaxID=4533 RepID=J3N0K7_ORYBR